jgi:hypothetical protein
MTQLASRTLKGGFVGPEVQSEQKYKRCCLPRDEAAVAERAAALGGEAQSSVTYVAIDAEDDGLDDASSSVIDLIDAGRLDEAEQAAHDLLTNYLGVHDGIERLAMVNAARGDRARAAEYYRKAADFPRARRSVRSQDGDLLAEADD